ncbi:GNAT family N-acetyltransferase [Propioniciclava coleopterorum]|uniref:GNAT family N-acetyltransferase n=1 Tax=Propioniciclava coleopterorum TaxID=2714937 RepID=A0A6G7Y779_9ACTN|nr:GNAT family protein [Propioniciclava coleopterorum]QIK72672.1 GNAT family N-acetyltransferase [Propioniciclava coleopterorum]
MGFLDPVTLLGREVRLEPLTSDHAGGLADAARLDQVWGLWYTSAPEADRMRADIDAKLARAATGEMLPFAVLRPDGVPVGVTTYLHPLPAVPAVEIGMTWLAASARRTAINTEAKKLLLGNAFEAWGCRRVAFRTTWLNLRSREAIERIGATFEGRIRNDRVMRDGTVTDSAQYSITDAEWPAVRQHLRHLLSR